LLIKNSGGIFMNIIEDKTFEFAIRVVNASKYLREEKKEYVLSKQLLRSGTSIGANVSEAVRGQSKKDFIAKMYISLKEANESRYWIRLLQSTGYFEEKLGMSLIKDVDEIIKIIYSIIRSSKNSIDNS